MTNAACLQTGEILAGKFCVERVIATGGVGVVVAARHMQLGETVALKFLIPQADRDVTDVARFVREAQSAVKLKNEHVARVLDVGSLEDGSPFMVMEYLEGSDLDQMLRHRGPLAIADAVDYVLQACEAIAEAHHLGIVHRDIKPSNFFLTRRTDGSPLIKVLDFGIAKARAELQQDLSLTKTRTVLGSPVYMSPEQIRSARSVDHRSDIWSLGVTLYELLTDQLPFDGDSITGVAAAVSADPISPIRSLRPDIPVGLSAIVEKCLEKKPSDRYQTVAEFAAALLPYGPETARYSLARIRGALNLRRESNPEADTLIANGGAVSDLLIATDNVTASSVLHSIATRHRKSLFLGIALLAVAAIAYGLLSARQSARSAESRVAEPNNQAVEAPAPVVPQVTVGEAPTRGIELTSVTSAAEPPTPALALPPVASASARSGTAALPPQKASAPRVHSAGVRAGTEKTRVAKDAQSNGRYEAIFDTRK